LLINVKLDTLYDYVFKFIHYEIESNPLDYMICHVFIPVDNPLPYIDKRCEQIRQKLIKTIITKLLKRQEFKSKVLLYKIINNEIQGLLKDLRKSTIKNHFESWFVISELELLSENKK
jgi:hypothetical protein